ncbi:pentatricopeptide repeat-containing protein [Cucumis melo var. makuwa]|uniref:Pentatricopeptide repeat-containing protein n=2 Tax=Cucumis melo TaxID=3656 RepID=A0A5D3BMH2_CUCMM|nr:pentatricopeptide repeat-containing protein [Cucumis melo var. makuwa]TYJ99358.1 pentatricopeptide repeat-containing protein [Cucumis melo var. makuwa]
METDCYYDNYDPPFLSPPLNGGAGDGISTLWTFGGKSNGYIREFHELGFWHSMVFSFTFLRGSFVFRRGFRTGKKLLSPSTEDIIYKAICVNLKQRRWKFLEQVSPSLTNSLVCRVVREFRNSPQLALEFYNWVEARDNFSHSLESCCTLVHVLVNSRNFNDALSIMESLMLKNGKSPLEVLGGLMNSYEICNSNPAVFDALVRTCTQLKSVEGAYDVIRKLRLEGFWVTIHAWNNFLNLLLKLGETDKFWNMYMEMVASGYSENVNTFNLIIYALCKECKLLEAISVVYLMLKIEIWPNVVSFNMIIDKASKMGEMDLALKLTRNTEVISGGSVSPNIVTYNCIINGFCKIRRLESAKNVLAEMIKLGIDSNERTYAPLIDGYARKGSLDVAFRLCDEMVETRLIPDTVVYNSLIYWLYIEGELEEASFLLSDMINRRILPDEFTYSILTKGLCLSGHLNKALRVHYYIVERNLVKDAYTHNILINYMFQSRNIAGAKQLLSSMIVRGIKPDMVTYGTLVAGHCKEGKIEAAVQIYDKTVKADGKSNLVVYNSILDGLCKQGSIDAARLLVDKLQQNGFLDSVTYNTLLHGFCVNGEVEKAFALFLEMINVGSLVNIVSYNIMINFLCKMGLIQQAMELMRAMASQGIVPDLITYTTLITNFVKSYGSDNVIELHDYMVLKGAVPDRQTYQSLVSPCLQEHTEG